MSFRLKILIQSSSSFHLLVHMYDTIGVPSISLPSSTTTFPSPTFKLHGTLRFFWCWLWVAVNGLEWHAGWYLPAAYEKPSRVKSQSRLIFLQFRENENVMKWRKLLEDIKLNIFVDTVVASRRPRCDFFHFFFFIPVRLQLAIVYNYYNKNMKHISLK